MRAREFMAEGIGGNADLGDHHQMPARGLNLYADAEQWNTDYTLNRIMMATACTDGTNLPDMDMKSWIGKHKSAHPYTQEEQNMLKMAYKAAGAKWDDLNRGNMDSEETPDTNKQSPITGFGGYR